MGKDPKNETRQKDLADALRANLERRKSAIPVKGTLRQKPLKPEGTK